MKFLILLTCLLIPTSMKLECEPSSISVIRQAKFCQTYHDLSEGGDEACTFGILYGSSFIVAKNPAGWSWLVQHRHGELSETWEDLGPGGSFHSTPLADGTFLLDANPTGSCTSPCGGSCSYRLIIVYAEPLVWIYHLAAQTLFVCVQGE